MKTWKRNAIVASVLVLVCAGIYLNWLFGDGTAKNMTDTLDANKVMGESTLVMAQDKDSTQVLAEQGLKEAPTATEYFAQMRLSRQESRDQAVELLQETISYAGENDDIKNTSAQLENLVNMALSEAQIESLVISKGYADCVAYMTDDGIILAVSAKAEGLQEADVALLTDIITSQTDYKMTDIQIIGV